MRRLTHGTKRQGALRATALLALLTALLAAPATSSAAATWLPSAKVSGATNPAGDIDVAMDRNGNVLATWFETISGQNRIRAAYRPAGSGFGPAQTLSTAGADASQPHPAFDGGGRAVVVWLRGTVVQFATRAAGAGSGFSAAQDLSNPAVASEVPQIAMASDGTAFVTYVGGGLAQVVIRHPDGTRDAPVPISSLAVDARHPITGVQVAVNAAGDSVYSWDTTGFQVQASYRARGAASGFSAAQTLTSANQHFFPQPAVDPQGRATIAWETCTPSCSQINSSSRQAGIGQPFSAPEPVIASGSTFLPDVAVDSEGSAVAIWINDEGSGNFRVQTSFRPVNSSFQSVQNVGTATGNSFGVRVGFDPSDKAIALFVRQGGSGATAQAATRPKGGSFGGVDILSGTGVDTSFGADPALGIDSAGNAVAAWIRNDGTRNVAEFAGYDAAPPELTVNAPASGTPGQSLGFSAITSDVWSAVTTRWDFGDGATATGNSVGHTYGSAGTYQIAVTATDANGNATSASRTVQVAAPSPPPGPGPGPGPGSITLLPSTVSTNFLAFPKGFTKIVTLAANDLPAGARVRVQCKTKKKRQQKKGCPYKSRAVTTTSQRTRLVLRKPFKKKKLPAGTRLTITMTAPGYIGKEFRFTMRKGKAPKSPRRRCIPPGGKPAPCA